MSCSQKPNSLPPQPPSYQALYFLPWLLPYQVGTQLLVLATGANEGVGEREHQAALYTPVTLGKVVDCTFHSANLSDAPSFSNAFMWRLHSPTSTASTPHPPAAIAGVKSAFVCSANLNVQLGDAMDVQC